MVNGRLSKQSIVLTKIFKSKVRLFTCSTVTIDFQLPAQPEYQEPVVVEYEPEPIQKEFKEKVVESLGSGKTEFKKRKIGASTKRNARQRLDDD